jgi:putative transposase
MYLSQLGTISDKCWNDIPNHFPFVELAEYVVMPNHVHGIIIINKPDVDPNTVFTNAPPHVETQDFASTDNTGIKTPENININPPHVETQDFASPDNTRIKPTNTKYINPPNAETQNLASLQAPQQTGNKFAPQSCNLASIIRGFKIGVTKYARQNIIDFGWQARFHDHIIRNEAEYKKIRNYILANPALWKEDRFYGEP